MNIKKYLEKRIRDWLPNEHNLQSFLTTKGRRVLIVFIRVLILFLCMLLSVASFLEGNKIWARSLWIACLFGISCVFGILTTKGRKVLIVFLCMLLSVALFLEGNPIWAHSLWISCGLGISVALDILKARGKELNEKLVTGLMLLVLSLGCILANLYIFSMPTSISTRVVSVLTLIIIHVPLLFAAIAYALGKMEYGTFVQYLHNFFTRW